MSAKARRVFAVFSCAVLTLLAVHAHAANLWLDPVYVQRQAALALAAAAGKAAQDAVIEARNAEALSSASCLDIETARQNAALDYYNRGQPPDPSNIIQNTTCFIDIVAIQIPVNLTGIGFLDGLIADFGQKMLNGACAQLKAYINDLKNSAINQISGAVSTATGGALNISQLTSGQITVRVGGQNITLNAGVDPTNALINAGSGYANQVAGQVEQNIRNSVYDSIHGTLDPNANVAVNQALAEYKQVQCQALGVGANETCPCPAAGTLIDGKQMQFPQCVDTYVPWTWTGGVPVEGGS